MREKKGQIAVHFNGRIIVEWSQVPSRRLWWDPPDESRSWCWACGTQCGRSRPALVATSAGSCHRTHRWRARCAPSPTSACHTNESRWSLRLRSCRSWVAGWAAHPSSTLGMPSPPTQANKQTQGGTEPGVLEKSASGESGDGWDREYGREVLIAAEATEPRAEKAPALLGRHVLYRRATAVEPHGLPSPKKLLKYL